MPLPAATLSDQCESLVDATLDAKEQGVDTEIIERLTSLHNEAVKRRNAGETAPVDVPEELNNFLKQQTEKKSADSIEAKLADLLKAANARPDALGYFAGRVAQADDGTLMLRRHDGSAVELTVSAVVADLPESLIDRPTMTADQFGREDRRERLAKLKSQLAKEEDECRRSNCDNVLLMRVGQTRKAVKAIEAEIEEDQEKQRQRFAPPAAERRQPTPAELSQLQSLSHQRTAAERRYKESGGQDQQSFSVWSRLNKEYRRLAKSIGVDEQA
jgi:hypothetical protein